MRRLLQGFLLGMLIGTVLGWLYRRYLCPATETVPTHPTTDESPPDDFQALRGIGPVFAQRLHQAGVRTYADLSRLTPEEVAAYCRVPAWRVHRDDWIGQAAARAH